MKIGEKLYCYNNYFKTCNSFEIGKYYEIYCIWNNSLMIKIGNGCNVHLWKKECEDHLLTNQELRLKKINKIF